MSKKYDVISAAGEYTDREGNQKTKWIKCGAVLQINGKNKLKLDCVPIGGEGWFELVEPREQEQRPQRRSQVPFDDDIPFG